MIDKGNQGQVFEIRDLQQPNRPLVAKFSEDKVSLTKETRILERLEKSKQQFEKSRESQPLIDIGIPRVLASGVYSIHGLENEPTSA